jgi:hypothetical protein
MAISFPLKNQEEEDEKEEESRCFHFLPLIYSPLCLSAVFSENK